jgi:uncharacterized protein YprB with RNaseH-like and TPR domain
MYDDEKTESVVIRRKTRRMLPLETLAKKLEEDINSRGYTKDNFPFKFIKENNFYSDQLRCWGIKLFKKDCMRRVLQHMKFHYRRQYSNSDLLELLREELLPHERMEELYLERMSGKAHQIKNLFFGLGDKGKHFYHACFNKNRKGHSKNLMADLINQAHPGFGKEHGILPYDVLTDAPPTDRELTEICTKAYFEKIDCTRQGMSYAGISSGVIKVLRHGNITHYGKKRKERKSGDMYLKRFAQHLDARITYNDLKTIRAAVTCTAHIAENELLLLLAIAIKYDPELKDLPALREFIPPQIECVYLRGEGATRFYSKGDVKTSDGRVKTGGLDILLETKTGFIDKETIDNKIIMKHSGAVWTDGLAVDKKLVFLNTTRFTEDPDIHISRLKNRGFTVMTEQDFRNIYTDALALLYSRCPEIFSTKIPHTPQDLLEIHDYVSRTPFMLHRKTHSELREWSHAVLQQDITSLLGSRDIRPDDDGGHIVDSLDSALQNNFDKTELLLLQNKLPSKLHIEGFYKQEHRDILNSIYVPRTLYLDLETTGFNTAGKTIGLFCMIYSHENSMVLDEGIVANPLQEEKVLRRFIKTLSDEKIERIVYFSGKGFDGPFIERRMHSYAIDFWLSRSAYTIVDLCIDVFQKFSKRRGYEDGTLQSFEKNVLRVSRQGDVHGSEIPTIIRNTMYGIDGDGFRRTVEHNTVDTATLVLMDVWQKNGFKI